MSLIRYGIFICLLLVFCAASAQVQTAKPNVSMTSMSNGYYEYLPQGYNPQTTEKYPLIIFLHGAGEVGNGNTELSRVLNNGTPRQISQGIFPVSFTVNNQSYKFIVLSPQFTQWPNSVEMDNVINYAVSNYKVNINKIYLTGLSQGGGVIWEYCGNDNANYGNRIAAIVPICGASYPDQWRAITIAKANIAVWATHNSGDGVAPVSYTNGYVANINLAPLPPLPQVNPLAKKTIFPVSGHDAWTATYDLNFRENGKNVYEWMLQFQRNLNVVPVTGLEFNTSRQNNNAFLNWKTFTETNNMGFIIERSSNGINYDSIGFVAGKGINGNGAVYSFTDNSTLSGINYYRLKQIDVTGAVKYSEVRKVDVDKKASITIYPNPVDKTIFIKSTLILSNAVLQIYTASGRLVKKSVLNGNGILSVAVADLPAGMYFAEITNALLKENIRFIKN